MTSAPDTTQRVETILVVEDSPTQLEKLRFLLEESGFSVVGAADGKLALAAARTNPITLVISDIVMPEMDGYALCRALRADEALRHIPVILLTGLADPRDVIQGLESGANNFICKPYDDRALVARVQTIIANREIRKTASSEMGISVQFSGQRFFITADRLQVLDLLLSTYENAVIQTGALTRTRDELRVLNEQLEARIAERTASLTAEIESREQATKALAESELRYRRLFESAKDGILILDAETGTIVDVNPFMVELLAFSPEHFLGKKLWELGLLEDTVANEANFVRLRQQEYVRYEDMPLETSDGRRIEVEFVSNGYLVDGRRVIQCNIRDITSRVRAQEAHARLATAVDQAEESIVMTDTAGTILYVNPAFENMSGYTSEEAVGQNPRILKSGKQDAEFYRLMWSALSRGQVWRGRITNKSKDGRLFDEDASISPVRDAAGKVINFVAVKRDVTNETLLERQLLQSQKMEAIGRLAAGVAHDFNNLLGVIMGYGEIVSKRLADEDPLKGKVAQILKAGERAADLTRQLLAFGRKQVLQPRILDLNVVVSGMQKMLPRVIGEDVEVVAVLDPHLGSVRADPGQIDQILMNLAVNARDAMPEGGRITIETRNARIDERYLATHAAALTGPCVLLSVTDTGSGMDAVTQARIFEPFFTTKAVGKGTGLGLATVYGIVKQSDGFLWVYSEVGVGTTFKIYLPRVDEEALHAGGPGPGPLVRGSETVLLVEDEASLREMLTEVLAANGYAVLVARDGAEALRIAAAHAGPIQLMVTDVIMPGMTGPKVVDLIAQTRPDSKVLYISGYSDEAITRHGLVGPGRAFLSKPFGPEMFLLRVRESLDAA